MPGSKGKAGRPAGDATFPCPVVVDTREQAPFTFGGLRTDARDGARPLAVELVRAGLSSGDYSLLGFEQRVAVERKGLADLFGTLGQGRERFERELQRLTGYAYAAVVVEADWATVLTAPPEHSQLRPKVVHRSVIAWQLRYPTIHWWFLPGRRLAEITTFRLLERFWKVNANGHAKASEPGETPYK